MRKRFPSCSFIAPIFQDEDTQPLEKPIIAPIRTKNFDHVEKKPPLNPYSTVYMHELCGEIVLSLLREMWKTYTNL